MKNHILLGKAQSRQSARLFLQSAGEGHTRLRERGWGVPIRTRGERHCGTLGIFVLCLGKALIELIYNES
jgi:hypothetical protein